MNVTRIARTISAAVVAAVAAIASYSHMRLLAAEHGQPAILSNLLPSSVDGMLIVASAVLADDRAAGTHVRADLLPDWGGGVDRRERPGGAGQLVARVISAWPALALLVMEMLSRRSAGTPGGHRQRAGGGRARAGGRGHRP